MEAASRRAQRESQRRYRQSARNSALRAKMEARQQAACEVEDYENQIERLLSVHKESPEPWDWTVIYNTPPPIAPERFCVRETKAQSEFESFKPGIFDKLLRRAETKRQKLQQSVEVARAQDEEEYQKTYRDYYKRHTDWAEHRQLAWRILQGEVQAFVDALGDLNPFADVGELGAVVEFVAHNAQLVEIRLTANSGSLIPDQIKSLTASGKLSVKPMPKSRLYEIYRDFVCGVVLRVGRELFAFLPVQAVVVTVQASLLNTRTGQQGMETILSVAMYRAIFGKLNFNRINPFDAMDNFPHRMSFSKSSGFAPVKPIGKDEAANDQPPERPEPLKKEVIEEMHSSLTAARLDQLLADVPPTTECQWLPVAKAANLANIFQETKITPGISRRIAERIELAGYCVEPDARYAGGFYSWGQVLGVFKPSDGDSIRPTAAYLGAANLLKLCVLIAGADGGIDHRELDVFREVIKGQLYFTQSDRRRLTILERLLERDDSSAKKALVKVAKSVPGENRQVIARLLVQVASADNVISKSEYRALDRVFKAFELSPGALDQLIKELGPQSGEVTVQEANGATTGEMIPQPAEGKTQAGFALNMSRVNAITSETREVIGILAGVMEEEDQSRDVAPPRVLASAITETCKSDEKPDDSNSTDARNFDGLDASLRPIFNRLLTRDSWPRTEFQILADEFHLMPLGIYDSINEWADEKLGDFILEGEDPINIRRELINKGKI